MWQFVEKKLHLRHALLYEYNRRSGAAQAAENINNAYGEGTMGRRTAFDWFAKFRDENFDLGDAPRSGRPAELDEDRLAELLQDDCRQTTRELAAELDCGQTTVVRHLQSMGYTQKAKYPNLNHPVVFLHDNARPHVARATKTVLGELGWDVLPHPPYSPDLAPSDFHLFLSLSSALSGVSFNDEAELENWLRQWFASKDRAFYRRGIEKLVERWTEVVNNGGEYIGT